MAEKTHRVTSKCNICGCPVELFGGLKYNVRMFQGAKQAECSICNPQSEWKRICTGGSLIDTALAQVQKQLEPHFKDVPGLEEAWTLIRTQQHTLEPGPRCSNCGNIGEIRQDGTFHCENCNPTKKVHVVAFVYQGVLESVHVFAEDQIKAAQDKKTEIKNSKSFHENEDTVGLYENVKVE